VWPIRLVTSRNLPWNHLARRSAWPRTYPSSRNLRPPLHSPEIATRRPAAARVAQTGSLRQADAFFGRLTQRLECHPHTVEVTGSNPVPPISLS
jgi:hypothetical protein